MENSSTRKPTAPSLPGFRALGITPNWLLHSDERQYFGAILSRQEGCERVRIVSSGAVEMVDFHYSLASCSQQGEPLLWMAKCHPGHTWHSQQNAKISFPNVPRKEPELLFPFLCLANVPFVSVISAP